MKRSLLGLLAFCVGTSAYAQKTVVVNAGDIPPLVYSENGKAAGIAVDILDAVAKEGAYTFKYNFLPWPRAQVVTQESKTEGIIPLSRTAEREPKYKWVAELFQQKLVFVTAGKTPAPKTMEEVAKLRIGLLRGNQAEKTLPASGAKVETVTDEQSNAKKLQAKNIDAWLASEFVIPRMWKAAGGDVKELHFGVAYGDAAKVYLGGGLEFSKQDADAINAAVAKLHANGTVDKILAKYRE